MIATRRIDVGKQKEAKIEAGGHATIELAVPSGENIIEINIAENAVVAIREVQEMTENQEAKTKITINVGENAVVKHYALLAQGKKVGEEHIFNLAKGSTVKFGAAFLAGEGQKFEFNTVANHLAENSTSDLRSYGALAGASYAAAKGNLKISKAAQGANAFLASHALLLDKAARAEVVPALEIEANNIKAGHSASTTKLSEEQIFYCTSRGLEELEARKMIVMGFLSRAFNGGEVNMEKIEQKWPT